MKDYLNFSEKNVIVTGGRRGIGRAISIAFAERGAKVAVVAGRFDLVEVIFRVHRYFPAAYRKLSAAAAAGDSGILLNSGAD